MSLICCKVTVIPFSLFHSIRVHSSICWNHLSCELKCTVNCRTSIRISFLNKFIKHLLVETCCSILISWSNVLSCTDHLLFDFDIDTFIKTFHNDVKNICEVYSTIKELFESDLSSTTDSICCYFIALSIKTEYFIKTSKSNFTDELLSTST